MEQQQTELFALIGEIIYRLQISDREKQRLIDENHTLSMSLDSMKAEIVSNSKSIQFLQTEYNFAMKERQLLSNELDHTRRKNNELDTMLRAAEREIGLSPPVRQYNRIEFDDEISCVDTEFDPLSVDAFADLPELEEITPNKFDQYGFVTGYDGLPWNPVAYGSEHFIKC